jgi:hypothetical protein
MAVSGVRDKTQTRIGREIERRLASLNDRYSFFLFLEHEFSSQLHHSDPGLADHFTTDVFAGNPNAARIHVRLCELPGFIEANRVATFGVYFTASYEAATPFFYAALDLLLEANRPRPPLPERSWGAQECYYRDALTLWGCSLPPNELFETMSWIRHRRNAIVHGKIAAKEVYERVAQEHGEALNRFWKRVVSQLDFRVPTTGDLTESDALDLLKLLRVVIRRFDGHFASLIDKRGLPRWEAKRLFDSEEILINKDIAMRRAHLLRAELFRDFGLKVHEKDLLEVVHAFGLRRARPDSK